MSPQHLPIAQIEHGEMDHIELDEDDPLNESMPNLEISRSSDELSEGLEYRRDDEASAASTNRSIQVLNPVLASRMRKLIGMSFVAMAVFVPVLVYIASRSAEYNTYVNVYNSLSSQVIFEFENRLGAMLLGYDSLSVKATSYANSNNSSWPFVTMKDIDFIGASTASLTATVGLTISHLVDSTKRDEWERYVIDNIDWVEEAVLRSQLDGTMGRRKLNDESANFSLGYSQEIYAVPPGPAAPAVVDQSGGPYLPVWQSHPVQNKLINFNLYSVDQKTDGAEGRKLPLPTQLPIISPVENFAAYGTMISTSRSEVITAWLRDTTGSLSIEHQGEPVASLYNPVFDSFEADRQVVAQISATIYWQKLFENILPDGDEGLLCVIENECGDVFSFSIDGESAVFLGYEDFHEKEYNDLREDYKFSQVAESGEFLTSKTLLPFDSGFCPYSLFTYPSDALQQKHITSVPLISTLATAIAFILVAVTVSSYDWMVRKRIRRIVKTEKVTNAVLAAHFPEVVRGRLLGKKVSSGNALAHPKARIKTFLSSSPRRTDNMGEDLGFLSEAPIADLFLHCTVLFADISGFSAWSSEREPEQVFMLLETIFQNFDKQAQARGVFKVETIADSYVAVTGLPLPQSDHAIRMTAFARDCLSKANAVTSYLERVLGPGTGDLRFRFGLHSGQVTAGVLRGEKTRFQLFGDTVNTAARMESTGEGNKIQLSETTAAAVIEAGKEHWITRRLDAVNVKGKGIVKTFWALHNVQEEGSNPPSAAGSLTAGSSDSEYEEQDAKDTGFADEKDLWGENEDNEAFVLPKGSKLSKNKRLVDWLLVVMKSQLKQVIAQRESKKTGGRKPASANPQQARPKDGTVIDEVVEAFVMPKFDWKRLRQSVDPESVELSPEVLAQLREFVEGISDMYRDNPFHNFEHASHVTMSAAKLLNRIVVPEEVDYTDGTIDNVMSAIHEYTYGITSDALAQFAVSFSCLIHDVDHRGVPNGQLEAETPELGEKYKHRSIAEQNSVDLAWNLLMQPQFAKLKESIFANTKEEIRFRQYTVNLVMATDIFEKQMKELRQERWRKAFSGDTESVVSDLSSIISSQTRLQEAESANLKATIVLEHIIQAADVSHTMQHWKVYKKWNEQLFNEMYLAYEVGRAEKDPSIGWYKGELWFFDNYVIPLARKLEECGVFGVSSDECLNYATQNRNEWAAKGELVVQEMLERYKKRKNLEVGGFTADEINSFTVKELEHLLQNLIKKGRAFGSLKDDKQGLRSAAQAWLDALEIHERCPASSRLKDPTLVFPIFSGLAVYLKGRKILQDSDCRFEFNMMTKFVRDAKLLGNPVHYSRALAMQCDVQSSIRRYKDAVATVEEIKTVYDPAKHSQDVCKSYGGDRAAQAITQMALWYHAMGDSENAIKTCNYVLEEILPHMDPTNILNSCELILPIVRIRAFQGEEKAMWELFNENVIEKYYEYEVKFTPCQQLFKPIKAMMCMWIDPDNFTEFEETVDWLLEDGSGGIHELMDYLFTRVTGWTPSDIVAELCFSVAKRLHATGGDLSKVKCIVQKGMQIVRKAELRITDGDGNVLWPVAYEVHAPLASKMQNFALEVGIKLDARCEPSVGDKPQGTLQTSFGDVWLA